MLFIDIFSLSIPLQESRLVAGVAFKKTFSYAGFEMQPKSYSKPKIALLNVELELKSEKENAELRIENVQVGQVELSDVFVVLSISLLSGYCCNLPVLIHGCVQG